MSTPQNTPDLTLVDEVNLHELTGMDDLSNRENEYIALGILIGRAQTATGEAYPDMSQVAALFLDPEDRETARVEALGLAEDQEFADSLTDAQQCVFYARSQSSVYSTFN